MVLLRLNFKLTCSNVFVGLKPIISKTFDVSWGTQQLFPIVTGIALSAMIHVLNVSFPIMVRYRSDHRRKRTLVRKINDPTEWQNRLLERVFSEHIWYNTWLGSPIWSLGRQFCIFGTPIWYPGTNVLSNWSQNLPVLLLIFYFPYKLGFDWSNWYDWIYWLYSIYWFQSVHNFTLVNESLNWFQISNAH